MKIFIISSELTPFGYGGALGTVAGELAQAGASAGHDVTAIAPFRPEVDPQRHGLARRLQTVEVKVAHQPAEVTLYEGSLRARSGRTLLLEHDFFATGEHGGERQDDEKSAFLLAQAALQLVEGEATPPDVVHCIGWQTGFLPLLLRRHPRLSSMKLVFTVDDPTNLGRFSSDILEALGVGYDHFTPEGIEFHGDVSLLKAGVIFADRITLPARALAEEVQREDGGAGLHGLYHARRGQLQGVPTGLDAATWDPRAGRQLVAPFQRGDLAPKAQTKAELQQRLGLRRRSSPLLLCAGPFAQQDNLEELLAHGEELLSRKLQLVFAGVADDTRRAELKRFAAGKRERVAIVGDAHFDDELWHTLLGAADGLLLLRDTPERRLQLLRGLRYGAVPIVSAPGALAERVVDFDVISRTGTGFRFAEKDTQGLLDAIRRFCETLAEASPRSAALQDNCMQLDIGWKRSWELLEQLYREI